MGNMFPESLPFATFPTMATTCILVIMYIVINIHVAAIVGKVAKGSDSGNTFPIKI